MSGPSLPGSFSRMIKHQNALPPHHQPCFHHLVALEGIFCSAIPRGAASGSFCSGCQCGGSRSHFLAAEGSGLLRQYLMSLAALLAASLAIIDLNWSWSYKEACLSLPSRTHHSHTLRASQSVLSSRPGELLLAQGQSHRTTLHGPLCFLAGKWPNQNIHECQSPSHGNLKGLPFNFKYQFLNLFFPIILSIY